MSADTMTTIGITVWVVFIIVFGVVGNVRKAKRQAKPKPKPEHTTQRAPDNSALLEALQTQLDAVCEYALSIDKQTATTRDSTKRAQLQTRAAAAWVRAAKIQQQIDKARK